MQRIAVLAAALVLMGACTQPQQQEAAPAAAPVGEPAAVAVSANPVVELYTIKGVVAIELDGEKAPVSTRNFLAYVGSGHYNGTIFHRVMPGFMIQGGGMTPDMNEKATSAPIVNEGKNGLKNVRGSIAMARTNDLDSATSQFYINLVDNRSLDYPSNGGYAVFGKVVAGMDVVDAIAKVPTATQMGHENVPTETVVIQKAKRKE